MKAVSPQTQFLLDKIRTRQRQAVEAGEPLSDPFTALEMARKAMGREWDTKTKRLAIEALEFWVMTLVGGMLTTVMNEVTALGRFAANSGDATGKKAAGELATSMGFLEDIMKMFAEGIDFAYVAEQFFEDGQKAAAEAAGEKTAEASAFEKKCKPSVN